MIEEFVKSSNNMMGDMLDNHMLWSMAIIFVWISLIFTCISLLCRPDIMPSSIEVILFCIAGLFVAEYIFLSIVYRNKGTSNEPTSVGLVFAKLLAIFTGGFIALPFICTEKLLKQVERYIPQIIDYISKLNINFFANDLLLFYALVIIIVLNVIYAQHVFSAVKK